MASLEATASTSSTNDFSYDSTFHEFNDNSCSDSSSSYSDLASNESNSDSNSDIEYSSSSECSSDSNEDTDIVPFNQTSTTEVNQDLDRIISGVIYGSDGQKIDLCKMFGDSEEFLIDGDAVLMSVVQRQEKLHYQMYGDLSTIPCSSLHLISLVEQILSNIFKMGGLFRIVFFKHIASSYKGDWKLAFLRQLTIDHLKENTSILVETRFSDPFDPLFEELVISEKPPFILSDLNSPSSKLFVLQYIWLGLDFAMVEELTISVVEILGWYYSFSTNPIPSIVVKFFKQEFNFPKDEPIKTILVQSDATTWKCLVDLTEHAPSDQVKSILLLMAIAEALKPYLGISGRVQNIAPQVPFGMNNHLQATYRLLIASGIVVGKPSEICDIIDELFLCQILDFMREIREPGREDLIRNLLSKFFPQMIDTTVQQAIDTLEALNKYVRERCDAGIFQLSQRNSAWKIKREVQVMEDSDDQILEELQGPLYKEYTKKIVENAGFEFGNDLENKSFLKDFRDIYHWHSLKELTDEYQRLPPENEYDNPKFKLKGKQQYATFQVRYGISLEGKIEDKPITVTEKSKPGKRKSGGSESTKASIMLDEFRKKLTKYKSDVESFTQMADKQRAIDKCEEKYKECLAKYDSLKIPKETGKASKKDAKKANYQQIKDDLSRDLHSIFVGALVKLRVEELEAALKPKASQISISQKIQVLQATKKIFSYEGELHRKMSKKLGKLLIISGFGKLAVERNIIGEDYQLRKEKEVEDESLARFQMMHMGAYMEVESPKEKDPRVDAFNPDEWQRELFDVVDKRGSALIVAPTSSGKTYASYYCMESVLRESNDGVVVYVSPTKALVNQIAATVCARFSKRKNMPPGKTVHGVFTRDFRHDEMDCQILVTVPECLEILLLSPTGKKWRKSLRYVIFDEVHNIGGESRGNVWEHIINLIRCPFLALSATIENPEILQQWFQKSENFKKARDILDGVDVSARPYTVRLVPSSQKSKIQRHSDLMCSYYSNSQQDNNLLEPIHPIAMIKESTILKDKKLPSHISMSSSESLLLFDVLKEAFKEKDDRLASFDPEKLFGQQLLKRNDVTSYSDKLKDFLSNLVLNGDSELFQKVKIALTASSMLKTNSQRKLTERSFLMQEFPILVEHLKKNQMLPAIVFTFNREYCERQSVEISKKYSLNIKAAEERSSTTNASKKVTKTKVRAFQKLHKEIINDPERSAADMLQMKRQEDSLSGDRLTPLSWLNHVFKRYPQYTLVQKNSLGEQDAYFVLKGRYGHSRNFRHCLPFGISWHHGGNNSKMRRTTEMLFRQRFLNVIIATTTLAQGIHMPCKTVVFMGDSKWLNSLNYHQCAGRAGRRGFDPQGNVIFFGINQNKISRLFNAKLPLIVGNNPISLSLVLRLCILTSDQDDKDALSRALCLLENPLIGVTKSIDSQLRLFFMYCTEFLVRQSLIDKQCKSKGLAGFISHLHWHEPYNIALVHLLQSGELHALCEKDKSGNVTMETMENLMIVFNFLFARTEMFPKQKSRRDWKRMKRLYLGKKKMGSKYIFLPLLPKKVKNVLEDFKNNVSTVFDNYMNSAAKVASQTDSSVARLPLSKLEFKKGKTKPNQTLVSPFAVLVGKTNTNITEDEIKIPDTNINPDLLTTTIPTIEFCELNAHVLDFFHHGIRKNLEKDNMINERNVFDILNNFCLVLKTIKTSMEEMIKKQDDDEEMTKSKEDEANELLLEAISAVANRFQANFDNSFEIKKRRRGQKGCIKKHKENCIPCNLMAGDTTKVTRRNNRALFSVIGNMLTCETPMVVCLFDCNTCRKQFITKSVQPLGKSCKTKGSIIGERHKSHEVNLVIVQSCSSVDKLKTATVRWKEKLIAEYL